jgi:LPXTG-motif cell wall-anchored protein
MFVRALFVLLYLFSCLANAELAAPSATPMEALMIAVPENTNGGDIVPSNAQTEEIHKELRGLLQGIETAINSEKYTDLKPYFSEKLRVTTINQNVINTPEGIDAYFKEWFGEGGYLKKLNIKLNADALTELHGVPGNPSWGLVYGSGVENYQLTDGRKLDMKTRWTATVMKEADGKWRILALHIGTNFYDNPIFAAVQNSTKYYAAGGLVVGLLLGALGLAFFRRKKH